MLFTLPTGGFDPRKNKSHLEAAQAELSEEVRVLPACMTRRPCLKNNNNDNHILETR
jgi:hypothetical protein